MSNCLNPNQDQHSIGPLSHFGREKVSLVWICGLECSSGAVRTTCDIDRVPTEIQKHNSMLFP